MQRHVPIVIILAVPTDALKITMSHL